MLSTPDRQPSRQKTRNVLRLRGLGLVAAFTPMLSSAAAAADGVPAGTNTQASAAVAALPKKPAGLTELSLSLRESYDNNVFLAGTDPQYYPAGP